MSPSQGPLSPPPVAGPPQRFAAANVAGGDVGGSRSRACPHMAAGGRIEAPVGPKESGAVEGGDTIPSPRAQFKHPGS